MNIDYTIVLTRKEIESISEEKYNFIKKEASRESELIDKISSANKPGAVAKNSFKSISKEIFARELVFLKKYNEEDFLIKTLLTSKIIYPNTEMIINILLSKNITYEKLEGVINRIDKIKKMANLNSQILNDSTMITDKNLNNLCALLRKYYPYENRNYMIAKLVDIVVHEKDLYLSLEGKEHVKTR